jgi:hypothetical protein
MIPRIEVLGDRRYRYLERYPIEWASRGRNYRLWVPAGFILDGNSVPWFGRPLIPGDWTLGVIAISGHDLGYERQGRFRRGELQVEYRPGWWGDPLDLGDGMRSVVSRRDVDRWFAARMRDEGVPKIRRRAAYRAVRAAFWHNWSTEPYEEMIHDPDLG